MPAPAMIRIENRTRHPMTFEVSGLKGVPSTAAPIVLGCADDREGTDGRPSPAAEVPQPVWEALYARHKGHIDNLIEKHQLTVY